MRYASAAAFAQALGERLKRQAESEGVDIERLRKRVAFERFRQAAAWSRLGSGLCVSFISIIVYTLAYR